jgi:hypothetical protein
MIDYKPVEICGLCKGSGRKVLMIYKRFDATQEVKKFVEDCIMCYGEGHLDKIINTAEPIVVREADHT